MLVSVPWYDDRKNACNKALYSFAQRVEGFFIGLMFLELWHSRNMGPMTGPSCDQEASNDDRTEGRSARSSAEAGAEPGGAPGQMRAQGGCSRGKGPVQRSAHPAGLRRRNHRRDHRRLRHHRSLVIARLNLLLKTVPPPRDKALSVKFRPRTSKRYSSLHFLAEPSANRLVVFC